MSIIKLQSLIRGYNYRKNNLPNSIKLIHLYLENNELSCSTKTNDGRTNSCIDEENIINILMNTNIKDRLYIPLKRHWFDIAIYDYQYGLLPINIKSTTTKTADNTGNLTMCVYSITNYNIDLKQSYQNGEMSKIYINSIKNKNYNKISKRDYYFIIINKENNSIISNSLKGLISLTPNINNLPFQVKWCDNKSFVYKNIQTVSNMIKKAIQKPNISWRENFLNEFRMIE